jgi:mannosyltransferase OCH1-like enzyme
MNDQNTNNRFIDKFNIDVKNMESPLKNPVYLKHLDDINKLIDDLTNSEYLIIDADGVLLDFVSGFRTFLQNTHQISFDGEPSKYNFSDKLPNQNVGSLIKEFINSEYFINTPAHQDAKDFIAYIKEMIPYITIDVVTSCETECPTIANKRKATLINHFGDVFSNIITLPLGASKIDTLKKLKSQTGTGVYIDDLDVHYHEAKTAGHIPYMRVRKYSNTENVENKINHLFFW